MKIPSNTCSLRVSIHVIIRTANAERQTTIVTPDKWINLTTEFHKVVGSERIELS